MAPDQCHACPDNHTGRDFSNQDFRRSNFTSVSAKKTNFSNSNFSGAYFIKAVVAGGWVCVYVGVRMCVHMCFSVCMCAYGIPVGA